MERFYHLQNGQSHMMFPMIFDRLVISWTVIFGIPFIRKMYEKSRKKFMELLLKNRKPKTNAKNKKYSHWLNFN